MIDHPAPPSAPCHRVCRHLDIGGGRVDVAFDEVAEDVAASAAAARLAEDLVAVRIGCERRLVRVAAALPSGRPVATVRGGETRVGVSLSHAGGLVGAAVGGVRGVGLDIVAATEAGPALDAWFTTAELAMLRDDDGHSRAQLWAAKEAAFKAAGLDEGFRPLAVVIGPSGPAGFRWSVGGDHRRVSGQGVVTTVDGRAVAIAVASDSTDLEQRTRSM